ncbi:rhamnogalacturonyl hydrolase YesR [Pelomonas saccharophila]|uniref:Rhamnogalacturonyl hydrolase YesR n=1 Tax=Roseateles saccharophilus TaxID=304 RepID=A0ABU1YTD7_ROSSA|nr:glycoside hydrolase family 88 protein [Roseateles saccharophilus]MDR7272129.1 rhamnogalacturonyl hydrolase YesR [Roseateles saccharophilus]
MKTALLCAASLLALSSSLTAQAEPATPPLSAAAVDAVPWKPAAVIALAEKVARWQLQALERGEHPRSVKSMPDLRGWEQGALFVGLAALADHSKQPEFANAILQRGKDNGWQPGSRIYHADDHAIGAAYLWAASHGAGNAAMAPLRERFDQILAKPSDVDLHFVEMADRSVPSVDRWSWCDALFMAPPVWLEMARATGEAKYADFAKKEFWATTELLYDQEEKLYFRDSRFFQRRDVNGRKLFWSRGDGWVFSGLAQLPKNDPDRPRIVAIFRDMAAKLKAIQKPDGFWAPSLLGDPETALPESSGTGFYTHGFAWGIKAGLLDRQTYEPVVRKGWAALTRAVRADGKLGYVQPVGDRPDAVEFDDTQHYGVGAFLLAATAVADLNLAPVQPLKAAVKVENPSAHDQPAALVSVPAARIGASTGNWSVLSGDRIYAAQYNAAVDGQPATLSFVMPMKAKARAIVKFLPQSAPLPLQTQAILNVREGGKLQGQAFKGGVFHLRKDYAVPVEHAYHDGLVAFEGLGWESDKVAYRLYLDARGVVDIYGKKLPRPILQSIGQGADDYHAMADWGQDILQVDQSLGMGGLGEVRGGKATQIGGGLVLGHVANEGPVSASARVEHRGFDGGKSNLVARYRIHAGSALTFVDAKGSGMNGPVAAGLVHNKGMTVLKSDAARGGWGYIASWGRQSLAGDDLGLVLFFPEEAVATRFNDDGQTLFVTFKDAAQVRYAFAQAWAQDASGVRDLEGFKAWVATTLDGLNRPPRVLAK